MNSVYIENMIRKIRAYFKPAKKPGKELSLNSTIEYYSENAIYTHKVSLSHIPDINYAINLVAYKNNPDYLVFEKHMSESKKIIYIHRSKINKIVIT